MSSSGLRNVGPSIANPLLTMDQRNDVYRSITKAEAELLQIETGITDAKAEMRRLGADITKFLERQEEVKSSLSKYKRTLVLHHILPGETIGYIFSLLRADKVSIPHKRCMVPPQITVSHVCSKWREIALATPALWSSVGIMRPSSDHLVHVALELLFDRATTRGINLALNMEDISSKEMSKIFYNIVLPLHVKKLHLTLPLSALGSLSQESDHIIGNIDEIGLCITPDSGGGGSSSTQVPVTANRATLNPANRAAVTPQFLSRVRSLTIFRRGSQGSFLRQLDLQNLPWAQMRSLNCGTCTSLSTIHGILRQCLALEVCEIKVKVDDGPEPLETSVLTLPRLRVFHIFPDHNNPQSDTVLRSFQCPNLTDFRLKTLHWTLETYKIIESHYNLRKLLKLEVSGYPYPVSKVLIDAPMLQELVIVDKVFMDEKAFQGISAGKLGCCLMSLGFKGDFNARRVLDMVASRQRRAKQVVEVSQSWQDQQISGIKRVFVWDNNAENCAMEEALKEKVEELEELGVVVSDPCEGMDSVSEEFAWPGNNFGLSWQNVCDFPPPNCGLPQLPAPSPASTPAAPATTQPPVTPSSTLEPFQAQTQRSFVFGSAPSASNPPRRRGKR